MSSAKIRFARLSMWISLTCTQLWTRVDIDNHSNVTTIPASLDLQQFRSFIWYRRVRIIAFQDDTGEKKSIEIFKEHRSSKTRDSEETFSLIVVSEDSDRDMWYELTAGKLRVVEMIQRKFGRLTFVILSQSIKSKVYWCQRRLHINRYHENGYVIRSR